MPAVSLRQRKFSRFVRVAFAHLLGPLGALAVTSVRGC
jgi:hypothetical protein